MKKKKKIFLSYSWDDTAIANDIDKYLLDTGWISNEYQIERDVRQKLKISLKKFMKSVRTCDFVIPIISSSYLRSENCMYEAREVLKSRDYRKRTIPIITNSTRIFSFDGQKDIYKFWEDKIVDAKNGYDSLSQPHMATTLAQRIRRYEKIQTKLPEFIELVSGDLGIKYDSDRPDCFDEIVEYLGIDSYYTLKAKEIILSETDPIEQDLKLQEALLKYPDNFEILSAQAMLKVERGFVKSALRIYHHLIERMPDFDMPYIEIAQIHLNQYAESSNFEFVHKAKIIVELGIENVNERARLEEYLDQLMIDYFGPAS